MMSPGKVSLKRLDEICSAPRTDGILAEPYIGPLERHVENGDYRLMRLEYDNSPASYRLWNFLLTEEDRLHAARDSGVKIIGAMKDLGTIPVIAYALENAVAFYPDGAWWIPCVMELSAGLLGIADSLGIDESFCPVRAMLGAFLTEAHFPIPDLLTCSVGATCDDFSAIAQALNGLGYPILWWEIPRRRASDSSEVSVSLPGGFVAPESQVDFVESELQRLRSAIEGVAAEKLTDDKLAESIRKTNRFRKSLAELRRLCFTAEQCPLPALEMLVAEMLAIHFCSDQDESIDVMDALVDEVRARTSAGSGVLPPEVVRVFWVNPVADLQAMNLLEDCGGRICGSEYLFSHSLDEIREDIEPMRALAMMSLADPMVGSAGDRADRICRDAKAFGSEAMVISRIPGASHCALESSVIAMAVRERLNIPVVEIEVPPLADSTRPRLETRMEALIETVRRSRDR